ncbi:phage tail protein [Sporosarcina globispora]|uniref:Phage tail protein n=1 Tax=Sporosarcina globispora TaxID=1459 RepID=A0A0M0G9M8_SPOGL|nr:major tail protein [Sporosarcina globispora]KON86610.1 phage tail protein [Sporosarcina globispora]
MAENKVVFGLKNAHYAVITEGVDGTYTYATPVKLPGSTELTLEPKGEQTDFYADDILYFTTSSNQGYDATLTVANITEKFRTDVLGEVLDATDKVLTENNTAKPKKIALLFEFDGDVKAIRHVLYNCSVSRPGLASATKTESSEPGTSELTLVAAPRPEDGVVKRSTTAETTAAVYDAWYTTVYEKVTTP